jgi:hypothetical protein
MAENNTDSTKEIIETVATIGGILLLLGVLWWYNGGMERGGIRGLFIKPPPPIDSGEVYGPELGPPPQNQNEQN